MVVRMLETRLVLLRGEELVRLYIHQIYCLTQRDAIRLIRAGYAISF